MVGNFGMAPPSTEIDEKQRHAESLPGEAAGPATCPGLAAEQTIIGVHDVGVAHDSFHVGFPAIQRFDSGDSTAAGKDLADFAVEMQLSSQGLEEIHQRLHQSPGAAARKIDAPLPFQHMNQSIDGGGGERVAPHQKRMEAEAKKRADLDIERARKRIEQLRKPYGNLSNTLRERAFNDPDGHEAQMSRAMANGDSRAASIAAQHIAGTYEDAVLRSIIAPDTGRRGLNNSDKASNINITVTHANEAPMAVARAINRPSTNPPSRVEIEPSMLMA